MKISIPISSLRNKENFNNHLPVSLPPVQTSLFHFLCLIPYFHLYLKIPKKNQIVKTDFRMHMLKRDEFPDNYSEQCLITRTFLKR